MCFSPLPATQNAGEPCGPEMEMQDLSSWSTEDETQLSEGYDRVGLGGVSPGEGHRLALGVLNGVWPLLS